MKELKPKTIDTCDIDRYVMVLPTDIDMTFFEEGNFGIYDIIEKRIRETLYSDWNSFDICSTSLSKLSNGNMVFTYKAVPATARTMNSYSHKHILVLMPDRVI